MNEFEKRLLRLHALASRQYDPGATGVSTSGLRLVVPETIKQSGLSPEATRRLLSGYSRDGGRLNASVNVVPNWRHGHAQFATVALASSPNNDGLELLHRFDVTGHPVTVVTPSRGFVNETEYRSMLERPEEVHQQEADALINIVAQAFAIRDW